MPEQTADETRAELRHKVADEVCELVERKAHDYGDSFKLGCDTLGRILYENSIRVFDKASRFRNLARNLDRDGADGRQVEDEDIPQNLRDLAGYAIILLAEIEESGGTNAAP